MIGEAIIFGLGATVIGMIYYFADTARRKIIFVHRMAEQFHKEAMEHRSRTSKLSYLGFDACNYAPLDWPASEITIADCQEIPQYRPTREYEKDGFPGSWRARHKQTGEVIRVIGWRSGYKHRLSDNAIIKDTFERVHDPRDFERIYEPGDWQGVTIIDVDACEANMPAPEFAPGEPCGPGRDSSWITQSKFPLVFYATGPAKAMRLRELSGRAQSHIMKADDMDRVVCGRCGALMDDWQSGNETCEELRLRMSNGAIIRHKLPHIFE